MNELLIIFIGAGGKMYKQMTPEEARRFIETETPPGDEWEVIIVERHKMTYRGPLSKSPAAEAVLGMKQTSV